MSDEDLYFRPLLHRLAPVASLARIPGRGRGLVATAAAKKGEALWVEEPLVSLQHYTNRDVVAACDHCMRFVGSLALQLGLLVTVKVPPGSDDGVSESLATAFPALPPTWQAPGIEAEAATLGPVLACPWGCAAIYCSDACRSRALSSHHVILCPNGPSAIVGSHVHHHAAHSATAAGNMANEDATAANACCEDDGVDVHGEEEEDEDSDDDEGVSAGTLFQHQALATNESFLTAARLICRVLELWVRNGNDLGAALRPLAVLHAAPPTAAEAEATGGPERAAQLDEWTGDSLAILRALVRERMPAFVAAVSRAAASSPSPSGRAGAAGGGAAGTAPASLPDLREWEFEGLFSHDVYSRLLRALDLNCIEVKIDSPLRDYVRVLNAMAAGNAGCSAAGVATATTALRELEPLMAQATAARLARRNVRRTAAAGRLAAMDNDDEDHVIGGDDDDSEDDDEELDVDLDINDDEGNDDDEYGDGAASSNDDEANGAVIAVGATSTSAVFPHCNGVALFAIGCLMNHACSPNVQLVYGGSHVAAAIAKRDIRAGDELCVNYVDTTKGTATRRKELLEGYGFLCECSKCNIESSA